VVGVASRPGAQGFLFLLPALPAVYLLAIGLYLPYGIVLRDGWLQVGVRGVPVVGRVWRRQRIPLDGVWRWDVVAARALKAAPDAYFPSGAATRFTGDMRGPGVRHVLWLEVDPARVVGRSRGGSWPATHPRCACAEGYVDTGRVCSGTRRPEGLTRALTRALPGRRLDRQPPASPAGHPGPEGDTARGHESPRPRPAS
jgi:hypothetical protein